MFTAIIIGVIAIVLGIVVMTQPKWVPYLVGIALIAWGIWTIVKALI